MGVLQLNQIKNHVTREFGAYIDVSDVPESQREITKLTRGLAAWIITQETSLDPKNAAKCVTDGFEDNGIDALAVDKEAHVVFLVQSKWNTSGKGAPKLGDIHKFLQGFKDLVNAEFDRFNGKIQDRQSELEDALSDPNIKIELIVGYTGNDKISSQSIDAVNDLLEDVNDPIETARFTVLSQTELHSALSKGFEGQYPDLEVTLYDWGNTQEPYAAYYGQMEAADIAAWFTKYGTRLFSKNIRQFLGNDSEVNASLIETLHHNPERFWYLNNGITVLCERVERKARGTTNKKVGQFIFQSVSVVNGAQTVGSIGQAIVDHPESVANARVSVRFISLENCPPDFANEVTRGTNTQNRVERRDFVALDPEQGRLASELFIDGVLYAIKSGESNPASDRGFNVIEATVALACAHDNLDLTIQAKREIGRLWIGAEEDNPKSQYRQLFNSKVTGLQMWRSVEVLRAITRHLDIEKYYRKGRDKQIAVHGNRLISHLVYQQLPAGSLTNPTIDLETTLIRVPDLVKKTYKAVIAATNEKYASNYLASLFKNSSRCKEVVNNVPRFMEAADVQITRNHF